uniref:Tyr recombinase domain-containing protein n=1 Tax=Photinus pyralis TaxID=7054 RepID=A0A1Y1L6N9_PHOPY
MATDFPGGRNFIREAFHRKGVDEDTARIMLASLATSTLKQYEVGLKLWWAFCKQNSLAPFRESVLDILKFLQTEYDRGLGYGSLNSFRSSLSVIFSPSVAEDARIKRFFKGVASLRPPRPRYTTLWNPELVLKHLSSWFPNEDISLEQLSLKLIMLLALVTAHRMQTFSLIELSHIIADAEGVRIFIPARIKTSGPNRNQPVLVLPFFKENSSVCAATTLIEYLNKTKNIRSSCCTRLFISWRKPHLQVSSQTLSRWVKLVLEKSGVDINIFSAHSVRHVSTSIAFQQGINIDLIRSTAGWSNTSNVFARFYNRPISDPNSFAMSILKGSVSDHVD